MQPIGPHLNRSSATWYVRWLANLFGILLGIGITPAPSFSEEDSAVAQIVGALDSATVGDTFLLSDLKQGQQLTVHVEGTGGDLDPFVGVSQSSLDLEGLSNRLAAESARALAQGQNPLGPVEAIAKDVFVAWDDDAGDGYAASLEWVVPQDGDYRLLVTSTPMRDTFGSYRLLVGINAPTVLSGDAEPKGNLNIERDIAAYPTQVAVEQTEGSLTTEAPSRIMQLADVEAGDTLYVRAEALSGNLYPVVVLEDFSGKPIHASTASDQKSTATLEHAVDEGGKYQLRILGCCEIDSGTTGDYRLIVGLNAPGALTGEAAPQGPTLIKKPTTVFVGMKLEQITEVDQSAENFGAVVDLRLKWTDRKLAFSPDDCDCSSKTFTVDGFINFAQENGIVWPAFNVFNQQGRSWFQNQTVSILPSGELTYDERFSATLQAPEFDFKKFPFDVQHFYIRLASVWPEDVFTFADLQGFNAIGAQLGEEEWVVTDLSTGFPSQDGHSFFSFDFTAHRHLTYYTFRIFLPILIIILVSWVTFFIKDYDKRIDVASANLLLFIAFNFTISNDLPRLSYLTLLDTILVSTFVITGLVIFINVFLKRLEMKGQADRIQHIDTVIVWVYPFAFLAAYTVLTLMFT